MNTVCRKNNNSSGQKRAERPTVCGESKTTNRAHKILDAPWFVSSAQNLLSVVLGTSFSTVVALANCHRNMKHEYDEDKSPTMAMS